MSEGRGQQRRKSDRALLWALFGIALALLVNVVVAAAPECKPTQQIETDKESRDKKDGQGVPHWIAILYEPLCGTGTFIVAHKEVIDGLSTFVIAAFTIVLAWSTIQLWRETDRLAGGAEDTAQRQLRAYVFIASAMRHGSHNASLRFVIVIKNTGQTPAYKMTTKAGEKFDPIASCEDIPLT